MARIAGRASISQERDPPDGYGNVTANGSGFVAGSRVRVNGTELVTTYVSSTRLVGALPASLLAVVTTHAVDVTSPAPGGGTSTSRPLAVGNPLPLISTIAPPSATAGSPSFVMTIFGDGFVEGSRVLIAGAPVTTAYVSRNVLRATVDASVVATSRLVGIMIENPAPGGGLSTALTYQIADAAPAAPVLVSIAPASGPAGFAGGNIVANGSAFTTASRVYADGLELATTYSSSTRLVAFAPASLFATAGTRAITVVTPPPGGGTSAALSFSVTAPCSQSGCDDSNPCTTDTCGAAGCVNSPLPDGPFEGSEPTTCGTGACAAEGQTVCTGGLVVSSCLPGLPASDDATCNGIDDDCDGETDEEYSPVETSCGAGACARGGTTSCDGGTISDSCTPGLPALDDATCDGLDDDCDGALDEDFAPVATACGAGACAAAGTTTCIDGQVDDTCTPGGPAALDESCNGLDDDCDGSTDEDFVPTFTSCGVGACARSGVITCSEGVESDTCVPAEPSAVDATCDGNDDDCDGTSDEDFAPSASTCGTGACAAAGTTSCIEGQLIDSCVPGAPAPLDDTCDGEDDDCDGVADQGYLSSPTACGVGACSSTGVTFCAAGLAGDTCTPGQAAPADTTCDLVDEDCDGELDEDYVPSVVTCGEAPCEGTGSTTCSAGITAEQCTPRVEGTECRLLAELRPGAPKAWEDVSMWSPGGLMAINPNGNLQNRFPIFSWQPPGVGPAIDLVLHHNSAAQARQLGLGLGVRLGAALVVEAGGRVIVEDEDGTPRTFEPDGSGGFRSEVFDVSVLRSEGADYVLRSPGGGERVFRDPHGLGFVEVLRRDRLGDAVIFEHDTQNRIIRVSDTVGREALFTISGGFCVSATDPEGHVVDFTYDQGRLVAIEAPEVDGVRPRIALTYDGTSGRISSRSTPGQTASTTFTYDTSGRLATFTLLPFGHTSRIDYTDGQVAITDATRRVHAQKFAHGQVIASIGPTGRMTRIARDLDLRPVLILDGDGHATSYSYNANHDVIAVVDATGRTSSFTYDDRHNVLSSTDRFGDTTTYVYNAFDEVTLMTNALQETTQYIYDSVGNLTRIIDFAGVTRMIATYNAHGRPLSITGAEGLTTTTTYDSFGNVSSLAIPGLPAITQTVSPLGRTSSYTNPWGETRAFEYDALGRATTVPYGSGSASITRDADGRVTATETNAGGRTQSSAAGYSGYHATSLALNGVTVEATAPVFAAPPTPPAASCTPTCALRCGTGLGDTCGGLIDCACDPGMTCNTAGFCAE